MEPGLRLPRPVRGDRSFRLADYRPALRAGDYYSLYRVEGSAFGDFSCYRVGHAPHNGTLYLPAGFHDYGIATVDELFVALVVGRCEFLCEYQDEIDEVYHGLFEKRL